MNLSTNEIMCDGIIEIANLLRINPYITSLQLAHNLIRDRGASALADSLKVNDTLRVLNLSCRSITVCKSNSKQMITVSIGEWSH